MNGLTLLSLLFSILALAGTSPFWMKLLLRYFYSSGMYFFIKEDTYGTEPAEPGTIIQYENVDQMGITIRTTKDKWLEYTLVIYSGAPVRVRDSNETLFKSMEMDDSFSFASVERPGDTTSLIVATGGTIRGNYRATSSFPLTHPDRQHMYPSQNTFRIALIPEIPLSEFGLPDFFGTAQLKPVVHDYVIENEYRNTEIEDYS